MIVQAEPGSILKLLSDYGLLGFAVLTIFAFIKEWVVPGKRLQESIAREEASLKREAEWRDLALKGTMQLADAVALAEKSKPPKEGRTRR